MKIKRFMTPMDKVIHAPESTSIIQVAALMSKHQIGCIVIVRDTEPQESPVLPSRPLTQSPTDQLVIWEAKPVGIITGQDIVRAMAQDIPHITPASQLMNQSIPFIFPESTADMAAETMMREHKHHVFVVNKESQVVGIVSSFDVIGEIVREAKSWPWNSSFLDSLQLL